MKGFAISLKKNIENRKCTYLSEGVETGLSVLNVKQKSHVMAVLGLSNFKNINTNILADKVVICLDNDFKTNPNNQSWTAISIEFSEIVIRRALYNFPIACLNVFLLIPTSSRI